MKRTVFTLATVLVVLLAVFGVLVLRPMPKAKANNGCTKATLYGNYELVASGWYGHLDGPVEFLPANFSTLVFFNGNGSFTASNLNIVENGGLVAGSPFGPISGTYTIQPNCTSVLTIPNTPTPNPWDAVITGYGGAVDTGGDEIMGNIVSGNPNTTATFDAKRVAVGKWYFVP